MDLTSTHALIRRLAERIASGTGDEASSPMTEDVADFLSPERFGRERRQFFRDTPQVIGFAGELRAAGSFLATEVAGVPVLVTRDESGMLHAMVNACAHRGAQVAQGRGSRRRLACRFHGWVYDLDGKLRARPRAECFDSAGSDCRLTALPVSERSGLIVVGTDPTMPQTRVDGHLAEIEPALAGFGFRDLHFLDTRRYEARANWKIVSALSYESYHFATLHAETVAQWFAPNAVHDFFGRHSRWAFARREIVELLGRDLSQWPASVPGAVSHALFPGTVLITTPDDAQLLRTEPGPDPGSAVIHYTGVYRDPARIEASRAAYEFGGRAFETEDLPAAEECQRGLMAGRRTMHIGRNEPVVQFWHRLWRSELRD